MMIKTNHIAGIDEVGKGSLFGPVFAGAVILDDLTAIHLRKEGVKDSKELTPKKRAYLVPLIKKSCIEWGLGQASAKEIDKLGIRVATEKAMLRAIQKLKTTPKKILVDGHLPLRIWQGKQESIINGESHFVSIAAASILAKEARDDLIKRLADKFPNFGLSSNVGYPTELHRKSLKMYGPTDLHRRSFLSKIISLEQK